MAKIIAIVEGDGEVEAVPALIRRIHAEVAPEVPLEVGRPVRVRRNRVLQDGELERYVGLAANLAGADGCILVLLDANSDCPANLGPDLLQRARTARPRPSRRGGRGQVRVRVLVHRRDRFPAGKAKRFLWEPRVGVAAADVRIRRMKNRWGSCNPRARRIWLNPELARKPPACLEYVLVHELVHLIERRHTDRFRALMDRFLPRWRQRRDELNRTPLAHEEWTY